MITNYGMDNFVIILVFGLAFLVVSYWIRNIWWLASLFAIIGFILVFMAFWFFRDPERETPKTALTDNSLIVSPADGKILEITEDYEQNYMKGKTLRISIFLSPLDVHVNRIPISGTVEYFDYIKGKKLIASEKEASSENQQTHFGVSNDKGKILFKQIVGILARRLVWDINIGDTVIVGNRFGMMKFGSRMDIHLPINTEIKVQVGDKVKAGITYLAKLR